MTEDETFAELMSRLAANDQDAATVVFRRFAERLIGLARTKLDPRVLRKVDAEDVVQSAYRSFFTRHAQGRLEVSSWNELWSLLTVITARKCAIMVRKISGRCATVRNMLGTLPRSCR